MTPIVSVNAPQELKNFAAEALHQATLWQLGKTDRVAAMTALRADASRRAMTGRYGEEVINKIISDAFRQTGVVI
jgi:hypothetical protein